MRKTDEHAVIADHMRRLLGMCRVVTKCEIL